MSDDELFEDDTWKHASRSVDDPGSRVWLLALASATVVLGAVPLLFGAPGGLWAGYALAGPVTFTVVALFRRAREERFIAVGAAGPAGHLRWANALVGVGLIVAILQAARIGVWLA